ncbi:MAG: ABC transporter ATP-binding protein/permease [Clostridiales bacterium]|jgi:ATP-binding cassette subfamily B protein|nr:ABC transporter ATP-binding protein/permease [Clostridiales bacterium]
MVIKKIYKYMRGYRKYFLGAMVATALATLFSILPPLVVKITVDSVIDGQPLDAPPFLVFIIEKLGGVPALAKYLWICGLAIVLAALGNGICAFLRGRWNAVGAEELAKRTKDELYDRLQKVPYDYHVKAKTGDLIQRCTSDVETVRRFLAMQLVEVSRILFVVVFALIIMFSYHVPYTLAAVATVPLLFIISYRYFKGMRKVFMLADEKEGEMQTVLQENLSGVRVVRAFGMQKFETEKFEKKNNEFFALIVKMTMQMANFWGLTDFMTFVQIGLVLFLGVYFNFTGSLSLGTLLVFLTYEGMLIYPVRQLGRILSDLGKTEVSLGRIEEIINTPAEADTPGAAAHPLKGEIVFSHVNFSYEKDQPVLKDMSFRIKAGETIAILGATGSGKSSVMHLLLRLYDYDEGSITVNGCELRDIKKDYLRERIGLVLQEPFLYSKTVRENIRMAKFDMTEDEMFAATRAASIHEDIEGFEKGYETMVGEKGVTLSGGQKQRVAIARTLIKESDILIFDDSLSAVDAETDAQIRAALRERAGDVTTFIISQRITTLMEADRIFVFEEGRLADEGPHAALIEREGLYRRIWNIQNLLEEEYENE